MKLSIISCTYNSEKYLQECINSVINQNLDVSIFEHIFVDAYSTDNTKKIIEEYKQKYPNVKLIEREPKWVYNAMNEWIKEAKWEYILCLNTDDYLVKKVLNKYIEFVDNNKEYGVFTWRLNFIKNNKIVSIGNANLIRLRKFLFTKFWCNVFILHPATIVKRKILIEMWYFDESKKIVSDYWMRLKMLKYGIGFWFYPQIISNFRIHDWSLSSNKKNDKIKQKEWTYFKKLYLKKRQYIISNIIDNICKIYWNIIIK